jgi:hypothetical protein
MFDERSFDTKSYDTRSWFFSLVVEVFKGVYLYTTKAVDEIWAFAKEADTVVFRAVERVFTTVQLDPQKVTQDSAPVFSVSAPLALTSTNGEGLGYNVLVTDEATASMISETAVAFTDVSAVTSVRPNTDIAVTCRKEV